MKRNIKNLIQELAKTEDEIYSKIGIFKSVDPDVNFLCNVTLLDGSELNKVRMGVNSTNIIVPANNSPVIVTFLSKEEAFISLIANAEYTRIETVDDTDVAVPYEFTNENGKSVTKITNVKNYDISTKNGGSFKIISSETDDTFFISDVNEIKLGVNKGNKIIINEDSVDIEVNSTSKVKIGNEIGTLRDILVNIIDTLLVEPLIPTVPTVVLDPITLTKLKTLKKDITALLE